MNSSTKIKVDHFTSSKQYLTDPSSADARTFCLARPCIEIGFLYDPDLWHQTSNKVNYSSCLGLIDTGADYVYVDKSLVEKYDCPPARGGQNIVINGLASEPAREGQLFLIDQKRTLNLWVLPRDFKAEGKPYEIVLGRRFLQFCKLTWDGPSQKVSLEIGENASAY